MSRSRTAAINLITEQLQQRLFTFREMRMEGASWGTCAIGAELTDQDVRKLLDEHIPQDAEP